MLSNLAKILQDECQIDFERPVLVAVSGGADSLCIAEFMIQAGYQVVVAHFDHKLRSDSGADANFVRNYSKQRDIHCISGSGDIAAIVKEEQKSVEEAARNARYTFLFKSAEEIDAQAVVVGHNANDQVETVLMHLLRGSGLGGLGGMSYRWLPNAWHADIPLVRPLLGVWQEDIRAYCQENGLSPVQDGTNQDRSYFRNRLRLELVPYLETFNPAASRLIWQTAQVLQGDADLIDRMVDTAWSQCLLEAGDGFVAVNSIRTLEHSLGMQRHLVRRAIAHLRPDLRDISFEAVERAVDQLQERNPYAQMDLISDLKIVSEPGTLWIAEWDAELPTGNWPQVVQDRIDLAIGGDVKLQSGWQISAEQITKDDPLFPARDEKFESNQVWLDLERIELALFVRARMDGDRFRPFGMQGHSQKLSDYMINRKIPRRARDGWPLVCSAGEIVWVAGYQIANSFGISRLTQKAVRLTLEQPDGDTQ
jgi:tRNA(Ile)-lysidine synthase